MIHHVRAFARAGLIGNPSDGYYGKAISIITRNFSARVTCFESPRIAIRPLSREQLEFESLDALVQDVQRHGYYGAIRLIKAAIKRFRERCGDMGVDLGDRSFTIEYETDIPVRVGLAGSSAIITATIGALAQFYDVVFPKPLLPGLILSVELDELGIGAGLQDRVIQVYEGAVFMDFDRELMQSQGHGRYVPIDPLQLPPLFVAYHDTLAEGTEIIHNDLRSRFDRGDPQVMAGITRFADLAQQAQDLIVAGRSGEIGPLMDENFDLRSQLCSISDGNRRLVAIGRSHGAATKFAGSGGAVIGTYDGDPARLRRLAEDYERFGAKLVVPQVDELGAGNSEL